MIEWLLTQAGSFNELITLVTLIAGGGLWVVKMMMAGRKRVEAMFAQQTQMKAGLDDIMAQLKPNGGHSMFDLVKQAHKQSLENANVVAQTLEAVDRIKAYQWNFAETLTDKPIWECDDKGACVRVNLAYAKLAERTVAELTGAGWENFIYPDDRARVYEEWHDAITRKRMFEGTFRVKSRSGKVFSVKATSIPVITEAGKITGYLGRYDEVTQLP